MYRYGLGLCDEYRTIRCLDIHTLILAQDISGRSRQRAHIGRRSEGHQRQAANEQRQQTLHAAVSRR
jgi:hypothetical protein